MTAAVFEARDASFLVRGRALVAEASLALRRGKISVIVGPNGAGKSTFLKLMSGEIAPHAGEVISLGARLGALPVWRLACRRAVMTQASRLSFPFPVHEVVRLGAEGLGRRRRGEIEALVEGSLEAADVLALAGRDYQTLSGGEQQRVQFARALCQLDAGRSVEEHQALFVDEPIASLDLCHQLALLDAVRARAAAGIGVLHDLNLAAAYADTLAVMDRGRIVAAGPPAEVLTAGLIRKVFRVEPGPPPADGLPVILPQYCRRLA